MEETKKQTILKVEDLVVQFTSGENVVNAVNGISFELNEGETLGLVGETGAGKTTIAKSILRILPEPPAKIRKGRIEYKGQDLLKLTEKEVRRIRGKKISMIFQDPMTALNPMFSVGRQITEAIKIHEPVTSTQAKERAVRMLELVGIPGERYNEYPHQFSGGMKQRVVIALAIACNPELLIADEPTTALDVTIQAQVLDMMVQLKEQLNTSMILITHDLGVVAEMCDRVAIVYAGEIVELGTREHIFDEPAHPYTKGLFEALPSVHTKAKRLKPIEGQTPDPTNLPKGCKFHPRCPYMEEGCKKAEEGLVEISSGHWIRCSALK